MFMSERFFLNAAQKCYIGSKRWGQRGGAQGYQDLGVKSPGGVKGVGPKGSKIWGEITRWGQQGGGAKGVGSQGAGKDAGTWAGTAGPERKKQNLHQRVRKKCYPAITKCAKSNFRHQRD